MSTTKPQKLFIHTHNGKQLFHVSIHNVDTKTGTSWKVVASKAKYAYEKLAAGHRNLNEKELTGGLNIAMVNTDYKGWETTEYPGEHTLNHAYRLKDDLIDEYEETGFKNVGIRTASSKRDPNNDGLGSRWSSKFNVSMLNKKKIYEKIDFINTSLNLNIPDSVRNSAYLSLVREDGKIDNMATLLLFIRNKMGLA